MALSLRTMARIIAATFIINCLIGLHPAYTSGKQFSFECVLSFQWYFKSQRLTISSGVCEPPCGANGRCSVATGKCECYLGYTGDTCSEGIATVMTSAVLQTQYLTFYHQKHCHVMMTMEDVSQFVMTPIMDVFAPVLTVLVWTELTVMVQFLNYK